MCEYEGQLRREALLNIERLQASGRVRVCVCVGREGWRGGGLHGPTPHSALPLCPRLDSPLDQATNQPPTPPTPHHHNLQAGVDDDLPQPLPPSEAAWALAEGPVYEVPTTGARATLENSQVLLNGYVARLPADRWGWCVCVWRGGGY